MKHVLAGIFTLTSAMTAQAQTTCPTAADMANGVRFHIVGGDSETFRQLPNSIVQAHYRLSPGETIRTLLAKGIYLLEVIEFENGKALFNTRTTYAFPLEPTDMPAPNPGNGWSTTVARLDKGELGQEVQVYNFGQVTTHTYGACSYRMMPIEIQYPEEKDSKRREVLHYLPELGLSYLAEYHDQDGSDVYTYINIEVLK